MVVHNIHRCLIVEFNFEERSLIDTSTGQKLCSLTFWMHLVLACLIRFKNTPNFQQKFRKKNTEFLGLLILSQILYYLDQCLNFHFVFFIVMSLVTESMNKVFRWCSFSYTRFFCNPSFKQNNLSFMVTEKKKKKLNVLTRKTS